jgi:hypothetical protein
MDQYEPIELDTYNDVLKSKYVIHHIERIPLPFPMTLLGIFSLVLLEIVFAKLMDIQSSFQFFLFHIIIPGSVAYTITLYEPEGINGFQWFYSVIRRLLKPKRKIVNRAVSLRDHRWKQVKMLTRVELKSGGGDEK